MLYWPSMITIFPQDKPNRQQQRLSSMSTAAGDDVRLRVSCPTAAPSPASASPSSSTLRRSAGLAGSSPPGDTTPTTAKAPARSPWGETSERPTTPRCAPSCMRSSSPATRWGRPAVSPTDSSPSVCCISMMRRTWFWSSMTTWWRWAAAVTDRLCTSCTFSQWDNEGWEDGGLLELI